MSKLSQDARTRLGIATTDFNIGDEIADAIESAGDAAEAVADIADPSTADAEEVANKVNELLASLRAAGKLKE